ncbi:MAG: SpoIIE family protein phosphatase [Lentimicrobiaceae bacterium]|nr:SpoIIE family protein phosphatase [Lentimicrobiaceae bacterium]MCB9024129.1 SpoIIE family protein phosphatase [Lentimicrobiaceae bacterium]MCO5264913.1 SpoIIE family protein phosphatase [Lentimicrobium sp.]HPG33141.1 SpoIIE family protein phosphatase [Lentimicrobium sp.]
MDNRFYIEVNAELKNHHESRICGDVFLSRRIKEENRIVAVLSDGMGHGVKANMLATLTATMALNFTLEHKEVHRIAEIIMNTLPVCSERKMSYSTFTIIDIEFDGKVRILEYDNPQAIILRGKQVFEPEWTCVMLGGEKNAGKELKSCEFMPEKEDRIIFFSDGVAQSGLGTGKYLFGWGRENVLQYVHELVNHEPELSALQLSHKVVNMAHVNDAYLSKDDTSCGVIYFRDPRKLLVCTGPPFEDHNDALLARQVNEFQGQKIICGATTADIISRELNRVIEDSFDFDDPDLPPISMMDGVDLVTEGILTLGKVTEILKTYSNSTRLTKGPADRIVKMLIESDEIHFLIGTRINIAHQDPSLPVELEIRRTVVKRIARLLEEKFLKEVSVTFI